MGVFAGIYFWFPKMTGRFLDEGLGTMHFWLMFVGMNLAFMPMHILGLQGMPRRIATYQPDLGWNAWNLISTIGAFTIALGMLIFLFNFFKSLSGPRTAGDDPWEANSLEWLTTSPPPEHNFDALPEIHSERPAWDARIVRERYRAQTSIHL
jgi:cytochrome c oxidase subunit I